MTLWLEIPWLLLRILFYYLEALYRLLIPIPEKDISQQVALITGAGSGIGRQLAYDLAALNVKLALWDINKDGVQETARKISDTGGVVKAYVCDVTDVDAIHKAAEEVRRDVGDVDILINNAGIFHGKTFADTSNAEVRRIMDINLMSNFWTVKEFLPQMKERRRGHVVTVCSMAGRIGVPYVVDYCAAKSGSFMFTQALSEELRQAGVDYIPFTCICPMYTRTPLMKDFEHEDRFHAVMEPRDVTMAAIEGIRRNRAVVYVPADMKFVEALSLMPRKAMLALVDFTVAKFLPKK